ncbi:Regulator of telomere elongation helicase 1 -like protein [Toxocara canis]|uniref:Regulator of telomere elongation helicase 1-like protein n=1 Tax=Toxocara canis TaxID=6265 RepID=A0A0B2UHP4_TOXCA|nr:Regulator of telomere elongation helicase 1 -like protein [Toxocara canis]
MKLRISIDATGNPQGASSGSLYPKIIYASRTHSQLAQVVRELNKTTYKDVKTVTLASRDFLCINESVVKESNSATKALICRNLVKNRKCRYYNEYDRQTKESLEMIYNSKGMVPDIEDVVNTGKKYSQCPFYRTRSLFEEADLLLMPYNYIIDPRLRRIHNIEVKGNIIIFDEAHNLESVCEEAVSVSFSSKQLSGCIREAKTVLEMLMDADEEIRTKMDNTDAPFGSLTEAMNNPAEVHLEKNDVARLLAMLQSLEEKLDDLKKSGNGGKRVGLLGGKVYPGSKMVELLEAAAIRRDIRDELSTLVDRIGQYLVHKADGAHSTVFANNGHHLQQFASFVSVVYVDSYDPLGPLVNLKHRKAERINDHRLSNFIAEKFQLYVTEEDSSITLNYWCFTSLIAMRYMYARGVRSIIVTSGTLSPLETFIESLGVGVPITLENKHVARSDQILGACIYGDSNGLSICGTYKNRSSNVYLLGVGSVIARICALVPEGVLVFFSSYVLMNTCIRKWKAPNSSAVGVTLWSEMARWKKLFEEPKSKIELRLILAQFRESVSQDNGAVLFAVSRAKVSEGIDFSDGESRAVLMVGVPFAPPSDPRVELKKQYLNECNLNGKNKFTFTANEWYQTDALRAVNQAIGRVLRHKNDFGAVVLIDCRFCSMDRKCFPAWMRDSLKNYKNFDTFEAVCAKFFKDHGLKRSQPVVVLESQNADTNNAVMKRKIANDEMGMQSSTDRNTMTNTRRRPLDSVREFDALYDCRNISIVADLQTSAFKSARANFDGMIADIEEMSEWKPKELELKPQPIPHDSAFVVLPPTQPLPNGTTRKKIKLKPNSMASSSKVSSETSALKDNRSDIEILESWRETPMQFFKMVKDMKNLEARAEVHRALVAYKSTKQFYSLIATMSSVLLPEHCKLFKGGRDLLAGHVYKRS